MKPLVKEVLPPRSAPMDLRAVVDKIDEERIQRTTTRQLILVSFASILVWKVFEFYGVW